MPRVSKSSQIIDRVSVRLQGIRAINETLDLGNGVSVAALEASLEDARTKEDSYNLQISVLEEKHAAFEDAEKLLGELSSRFLSAIAGKYGRDSVEYTQAGGVRMRDRKRPSRKPKTGSKQQG